MTRDDIEEMLIHLAATTRSLQECGRMMHDAAEHLNTVIEQLQQIAIRTEAAITAGLRDLREEHDDDPNDKKEH